MINVMLGMLSAIRKAPLFDRMIKEGRLDTASELEFSTNIVPLRLRREQLRDGFVYVLSALNETEAYFDRVEALYVDAHMQISRGAKRHWRRHPWQAVKARGLILVQGLALLGAADMESERCGVASGVSQADQADRQGSPRSEHPVGIGDQMPCHYHAHTMARRMSGGRHR